MSKYLVTTGSSEKDAEQFECSDRSLAFSKAEDWVQAGKQNVAIAKWMRMSYQSHPQGGERPYGEPGYRTIWNAPYQVGDGMSLLPMHRPMGRPSQGREKRMQFTATPELAEWLEAKRRERGEKSVSTIIFELLERVRNK